MKCFRIDDGGEFFYYAAETSGVAISAYLEEYEGAEVEIREVLEEEMASTTVHVEDENQFPSGSATLLDVFGYEVGKSADGPLLLCSSAF